MKIDNLIKIILAILFFVCLADIPYGFFQLVRFAAMIGFTYLAYSAHEQSNKNEVFVYVALALLFQPFIKIALGRTIWNIVDVVIAIGLLVSIKVPSKRQKKN